MDVTCPLLREGLKLVLLRAHVEMYYCLALFVIGYQLQLYKIVTGLKGQYTVINKLLVQRSYFDD